MNSVLVVERKKKEKKGENVRIGKWFVRFQY